MSLLKENKSFFLIVFWASTAPVVLALFYFNTAIFALLKLQ